MLAQAVYYIFSSICKDLLIFPVRYLYFLRTMSVRPQGKRQPGSRYSTKFNPNISKMPKKQGHPHEVSSLSPSQSIRPKSKSKCTSTSTNTSTSLSLNQSGLLLFKNCCWYLRKMQIYWKNYLDYLE